MDAEEGDISDYYANLHRYREVHSKFENKSTFQQDDNVLVLEEFFDQQYSQLVVKSPNMLRTLRHSDIISSFGTYGLGIGMRSDPVSLPSVGTIPTSNLWNCYEGSTLVEQMRNRTEKGHMLFVSEDELRSLNPGLLDMFYQFRDLAISEDYVIENKK